MNDIDRYLDQACRQVNGPDSLRAHLRKELKEHLEEAIDALVAEGMSRDDATAKAIEDLGDPEIVRDGMESVYGTGETSLFVEQAIKWNNNRWHRLSQICLLLVIATLPGANYFLGIMIAPKVEQIYRDLGALGVELPAYYQWMKDAAAWIVPILILLVAALGAFEWKFKSDNKTQIRTAIFAVLSFISANAAFWMTYVYLWTLFEGTKRLGGLLEAYLADRLM